MNCQRLLQRLNSLRIFRLIQIRRAQVSVSAEALRGALDDSLKHLGGVVILSLSKIERTQQVITAPVVRAQGDDLLIGIFCVLRFPQPLISAAQADVGVFVRWFELDGALELINRVCVLASAALDHAEANMAGGSRVAEVNRLRTSLPRLCDQVLILTRRVLRPVGAA